MPAALRKSTKAKSRALAELDVNAARLVKTEPHKKRRKTTPTPIEAEPSQASGDEATSQYPENMESEHDDELVQDLDAKEVQELTAHQSIIVDDFSLPSDAPRPIGLIELDEKLLKREQTTQASRRDFFRDVSRKCLEVRRQQATEQGCTIFDREMRDFILSKSPEEHSDAYFAHMDQATHTVFGEGPITAETLVRIPSVIEADLKSFGIYFSRVERNSGAIGMVAVSPVSAWSVSRVDVSKYEKCAQYAKLGYVNSMAMGMHLKRALASDAREWTIRVLVRYEPDVRTKPRTRPWEKARSRQRH
ncbi:hypothetical protein CKM354_000010300 [Cercospora kikuchii]|uniref:Uncharacterized protein n=1 Tax=Cercospora kikuchii TaxID=84275 RepID=A0A9P3F7G9_9PEZI|nr:uncharacterized protein CKM354_000010300 [Cercospora kikuchii]GIZ36633.1 hypothetical protein CKM354_000010300 [Cercospora kikuchii]